jgi:preprotein translocase SecE subunit
VARSTRQQRRQRRAQQRPALAGGPPARPPARPVANGEDEPRRPREPRQPREERRDDVRPGAPGIRFLHESAAELKKVEWPGQQQLIQGVAVVLIACVIVGTYLWLADLAFKRLVQNVFLGQ